jgi:Na+-transporting methylmalonyl-CoA/oxaloacetate decarboxylase gamma subunit
MGIFQNGVISHGVVLSDLTSYINMNTLFGVVVVLAVLLLIALVYLVNISSLLKNNSASKSSSVGNAVAQSVSNEQGELVDDKELAAVITAAVYAYMGDAAPADGLVVRSIRRAR